MTVLLATAPALPLHTAGPYVAAAYIVFLLIVLSYVGIMARRLIRNQREIVELRNELEAKSDIEGSRNSIASSPGGEHRDELPGRDELISERETEVSSQL